MNAFIVYVDIYFSLNLTAAFALPNYSFCALMFPDDETRVKLKKFPGDPFSDYINANFINVMFSSFLHVFNEALLVLLI